VWLARFGLALSLGLLILQSSACSVFLAESNATNLTDGPDGLRQAAGPWVRWPSGAVSCGAHLGDPAPGRVLLPAMAAHWLVSLRPLDPSAGISWLTLASLPMEAPERRGPAQASQRLGSPCADEMAA